jgi:glucuronate isomerase
LREDEMRLKLKDNKILCDDIISPEMIVATFENLTKEAMFDIVENNNFAEEVCKLLHLHKNDLNLESIVRFLKELYSLRDTMEKNRFLNKRKNNVGDL